MRPCALTLLSLLACLPAWAAVYHVAGQAPNASDDGPGSEAQPWRTIAKAASVAAPGDTVYLHEGRYPEAVTIKQAASRDNPIIFTAFGDDRVVLDGADPIAADQWTPVEGLKNVYALPVPQDPGQVFVDGKPLYMKIEKTGDHEWKLGTLTDDDANLWQYDAAGKRLLMNVGGGNPSAAHKIEVPMRACAFLLNTGCRLSRIQATRYAQTALRAGEDSVIEDCVITDSGGGIVAGGWDQRGAIIRRNTVIGTLNCGIFLQDRPTQCRVEENLVIRCTLNPWHQVLWSGSIKMNSASDSLFANNVILEAGNPDTINGWDGWSLWGDINIVRIMYLGNSCAHNKEAGLYIEWGMSDTRAYFNTSYRDGHGITCRASQRGVFMHNYVQSSRSSGLAIWQAEPPFTTTDNVFAHNLVRDCGPSLRLQTEQPELCDYNTYQPREGAPFADGEKGRALKTIDDVRAQTGHELHGEVRDAQPEDVGLETVTFRVPDAKDPNEALMMIGNAGCEFVNPHGVDLLPYFWRASTGDGADHTFLYSAYTGLPGGVDTFAYPGAGGTVALRADAKIAHGGLRCLEVNGFEPTRIPAEGLGFHSPTLPAKPGDTIAVTFWVRGQDLKPTAGSALVAAAEFTNQTGQQRQRVDLVAARAALQGTSDWQKIEAHAKVPETARRVTFFLGLAPGTGTLWFDDISIKVR